MAQRHPTPRKSGDQGHEADDIFVAKVVEYSTWAQRNTQTLILMGIALVVVVGLLLYYAGVREDRELAAIQRLEAIHGTANFGSPETAKAELAEYLDRFGGTPYAAEARMLLAELYLRSDQPQQAVVALEEADISLREPMGIEVNHLLGKAHEAAGNLDRAEAIFLEVAERATMDFQRTQALADAARIRMEKGNPSGAAELYARIVEGMELNDPERGIYEMRRAEAEARALDA